MIPLPKIDNTSEDVIFRMSFNATSHPVQMYNRVRISTRALHLAGIDPTSQMAVGAWVQGLYQSYSKMRNVTVGFKGENASDDQIKALITAYCDVLRRETCIQDYWVTLYKDQTKKADSKLMNL